MLSTYYMLITFIFQVCFTFDVAVDAQHDVMSPPEVPSTKTFNPAHPSFVLIYSLV